MATTQKLFAELPGLLLDQNYAITTAAMLSAPDGIAVEHAMRSLARTLAEHLVRMPHLFTLTEDRAAGLTLVKSRCVAITEDDLRAALMAAYAEGRHSWGVD